MSIVLSDFFDPIKLGFPPTTKEYEKAELFVLAAETFFKNRKSKRVHY